MDSEGLARLIDQTLLKPTSGFKEASGWLDKSAGRGFAAVVVAPFLVPLAAQKMAGSKTAVCSVAGFPLGYDATETKAEAAARLVELGALEIDVVMNIAAFLEGEDDFVLEDLAAVVQQVSDTSGGNGLVKVIIETGYLSVEEVARAADVVKRSGAAFVKTSTGFGPRGASVEDVAMMRDIVGEEMGVKAAGGIRDLTALQAMVDAGASRIGTSSGLEILDAFEAGRK